MTDEEIASTAKERMFAALEKFKRFRAEYPGALGFTAAEGLMNRHWLKLMHLELKARSESPETGLSEQIKIASDDVVLWELIIQDLVKSKAPHAQN